MIFDFLDPEYVKAQMDKLSNLNITLSQLRDDLKGTGSKTLTDIVNAISGLEGLENKTLTDIYNKLDAIGGSVSIANFPSWFTSSTVTTDVLKTSVDAVTSKLDFANWIGKVGIGNGTNVADVVQGSLGGSTAYLLGVAPDLVKMYAGGTSYEESTVAVSTTEDSSSFSPALKFVKVTNEGDVDALIRLNGSSATQIPVPAHTGKWFLFPVSSIYYSTSSGSTTLRIEGFA